MNDFTKKELVILYHLGYAGTIDCNIKESLYKNLLLKVKNMIDNYCEHEPEGDYHVCVDKCKHCGVVVE